MEEKKERRAVAKKLITPMMKEWQPISPKMPAYNKAEESDMTEEMSDTDEVLEQEVIIDEAEAASEEIPQAEEMSEDAETAAESDVEELIEESIIEAPFAEPQSNVALSDNKSGKGMGWYVVHTYSGYENKVKANIEKAIENRHLENEILEVRVPLQDVMEVKNGVEKSSQKKLFPGYVLLHMDADNNDAWYVVRNTRGVTGFVGPGSKPVPLTDEELRALDFSNEIDIEFAVGDLINVVAGVWKDTIGTVQDVDAINKTIKITIEMFGRETPVVIGFADVKKLV